MADTPEELRALEEATKALAQAQRELKASYTTEDLEKLKKSIKAFEEARLAAAKSQKKATQDFKDANKVYAEANRTLDKASASMKKTQKETEGLGKKVNNLGIELKQIPGFAGLVGSALLAGIKKPTEAFDKFAKPLRDIEINAIKTFGSLDSESSRLFVEKQKELRRFVADQATGQAAVDARLKTLALDPLKAQQEIVEEQNKIQATVGQNLDRFKSEIADPDVILNLRGLRSALGLSAEETAIFANRAAAFGTSIESQLAVATKAAQKFAKSSGVDFKVIAKGQNELRKNTKAFATFSEEQLARVAAASAKTGVALSTMGGGLVDSFDDFDTAVEKTAMLSQAFGIDIGTMDMFSAEPVERLQMIQEAASRAGVDIANMGRRELNYLSDLTGMGVEDTMKALGQGGLEVAAEVAGIDKAGDLQAQLVSANRMNTDSIQGLTQEITSLIPPISELGKDLATGAMQRAARAGTGFSGEMQDMAGEFMRRLATGGTANLQGKPDATGLVGKAASLQQDPFIKKLIEENVAAAAMKTESALKDIEAKTSGFLESIADPKSRAAALQVITDGLNKAAAAKEKAKAAIEGGKKIAGNLRDSAKKLANRGRDQGSMDEAEVTATGDTNAALRGGRAATATQGPINLVVNVSLPVDGDAIASAAYTGQIRPGVTGEQALQAAAANENPAGQ